MYEHSLMPNLTGKTQHELYQLESLRVDEQGFDREIAIKMKVKPTNRCDRTPSDA